MESLKEKTAKGLFWSALSIGLTQVFSLVFGIVLGRLLTPADYGIVGVLAIFTLIAGELQSGGFAPALINIKNPTKSDYSSVFWFNITMSVLLYVVLFLCSPLIARFFHEPRLVPLSRVLFTYVIIGSLGVATSAYMKKNMMNKELAICGVIAQIGSGTLGITLAIKGFAYWSLAWQQLAYMSLLVICWFHYTPSLINLRIELGPIRRMIRFSMRIVITNIVNGISKNFLTFIFGRLYPMNAVGNFSQAYKWDNMANSLVGSTVGQIAQPVMVSVKDEKNREVQVFRKMMRFTAFLSFPAMFGLALVAHEFIMITIGPKWEDSVLLLQILCIGGAFFPLYTVFQNLTISNGRSDIYMWCNIGQIVLQIAVIVALHSFGITAMVCAYSAILIAWLLVWQMVAHKLVGIRLLDTLKDIMPFCIAALATMAATYGLTFYIHSNIILLLSRIVLAAAIYYGIMKACHVVILDECVRFIRGKFRKSAK